MQRITVEAIASTEERGSVIDEQRRTRVHLNTRVARDIGDGHAYDMIES
jgi:hypothetical protein